MSEQPHSSSPLGQLPFETDGFNIDPVALQQALQYVDTEAPTWILEPTKKILEQPANQVELIRNLQTMLGTQQDGEERQRLMRANLVAMRGQQSSIGIGFSRLHLLPGYDLNALLQPDIPVSKKEYDMLYTHSLTHHEIIEDTAQPNVIITGLLLATGAKILREDEGQQGKEVLYKGMFEGRPVYFEETVAVRKKKHLRSDGVETTLERSFTVLSEEAARHSLNRLSDRDAEVLHSVGIQIPEPDSSNYDPSNHPNRSRMIEILRLLDMINPQPENAPPAARPDIGTLALGYIEKTGPVDDETQ